MGFIRDVVRDVVRDSVRSIEGIGDQPFPTAKKSGLIVRYTEDEDLAELMSLNGESVTFNVGSIGTASEATIAKWKRIANYGQDLGVGNNIASQSAFIVNSITPNNQAYYQAQDDLLDAADKGIMDFVEYNGFNYCLQNVEYPSDPLSLGVGDVEQLDFSTISGGSNITITPTVGGVPAVYLDSTKSYASDFPASALDMWWTLSDNGDGTHELRINNAIPLENYISAQTGSGNYSGADQLIVINKLTFYPRLSGLKYQYQENQRAFAAYGLPKPVSMSEVEQGGYVFWSVVDSDEWYNIMYNLGYKGATKNPVLNGFIDSEAENRYRIMASSGSTLSALASTVQEAKEIIADYVARNQFAFEREGSATSPLDLTGWQELITWTQAKGIEILSYKNYGIKHYDRDYVKTDNIFPRLNIDLAERADGTPDGYTALPSGITLITTGGNNLDGGYYLQYDNASSAKSTISELGGFTPNNTLTFYAKNDGSAYDEIKFIFTDIKDDSVREYVFPINSATWKKFTYNFRAYANQKVEIQISSWLSSGTVDISGIEIIERDVELSTGFEDESEDLFARMLAVSSEPDTARKSIIDETIKALKTATVNSKTVDIWSSIVYMHTQASHAENAAKLNWKENAYNLTPQNTPTFTADRGWQLNGTNQYLSTGFNPTAISIDDRKFKLNNGCLMVYSNVGGSKNVSGCDHGSRPTSTSRSYILINSATATTAALAINGGAISNSVTPEVRVGMFGASRIVSDKLFRGSPLLTDISTNYSNTVTNAEFLYGRHATVYSDKRYAFGLCAEGLTLEEYNAFKTIIQTKYLTPIGAN